MGHAMGAASQLGNRGRNYSKNNNIFNEICSINLQFRFGMYKLDENVLVWIVLVALENKEHPHTPSTWLQHVSPIDNTRFAQLHSPWRVVVRP